MNKTSVSLFAISATLVVGLVPSVFFGQIAAARENETEIHSEIENKLDDSRKLAEETKASTTAKLEERRAEAEAKVAELKAEREAAKQERIAKLDEKKLQVCQKQEAKVTDVMKRAADQGTRQLEVFKKIADRTKDFATSKNLTVENYDTLVAEVDSAYTVAAEAMNTISSSSTEFSCEGDNPKAFLSSFRTAHQQKTEAMKTYKTAVKNLIVAVKSSQEATKTDATDTTTNSSENVEAR